MAFGFAEEFFDGVAGEFGGGRVDEGGFALHVEAVDAFAGGVEDVFVSALECLELLGSGLDVEFEDVFGAFEFLALL